ncbi:MAG: hypothetical protein JXR07_17795 [Reichenbachiella sp.]
MISRILVVALVIISISSGFAQEGKPYVTSGLEIIFSKGGTDSDGNLRFAPVLNLQSNLNYDLTDKLGFYTGIAIRNVGFIYDLIDSVNTFKKFRSYNVGIPVGLKIGNLEKAFIYGGYELEIPIHYKEKLFVNEVKEDKFSVWFSDRTNSLHHSVFVGFQFFSGMNVKFKYYLNSFHNQDFEAIDISTGNVYKPYENINGNMWSISLNFSIFRNAKFFYSDNKVEMGEI